MRVVGLVDEDLNNLVFQAMIANRFFSAVVKIKATEVTALSLRAPIRWAAPRDTRG
jgi:hypothetical protein